MNHVRKMRPVGQCSHRPRPGAVAIEPGMWWDDKTQHLWISAETWLDARTHMLIGCLIVDFGVPGAAAGEAIGRVAMHQFLRDFPDAVPAEAKQVECEVCDHVEGGRVG